MKSQSIIIKSLLILIAILVVVGFFGYRSIQKDLQIESDARQELIADVKEQKQHLIDSLQKVSADEIRTLKNDINNLSSYSNRLVQQIKNYEKNPHFDIDYLTAVDIIARSNYRKRNDSIVEREND